MVCAKGMCEVIQQLEEEDVETWLMLQSLAIKPKQT